METSRATAGRTRNSKAFMAAVLHVQGECHSNNATKEVLVVPNLNRLDQGRMGFISQKRPRGQPADQAVARKNGAQREQHAMSGMESVKCAYEKKDECAK